MLVLAVDATAPFTASHRQSSVTYVDVCGGRVAVDASVVGAAAPRGVVGSGWWRCCEHPTARLWTCYGRDGGGSSVAAAAFLLQNYVQNVPSLPTRTSGCHVDLLLVKVAFLADLAVLLSTGKRFLDEPEAPEAWCNGLCYPRACAYLKARLAGGSTAADALRACDGTSDSSVAAPRELPSLIGHAPP